MDWFLNVDNSSGFTLRRCQFKWNTCLSGSIIRLYSIRQNNYMLVFNVHDAIRFSATQILLLDFLAAERINSNN